MGLLLGEGGSSVMLSLSLLLLLLVVRLGRVHPVGVLGEVLMGVHWVIGHHLGFLWFCVVAPRDAVLCGRGY